MKTYFFYPEDTPVILGLRDFAAPRRLVWEAFTSAKHMARWWGPAKYTATVHEYDFRAGGKWRIDHVNGDERWRFHGEFLEIDPQHRFVWTFGFEDVPPGPESYNFDEIDGVTRLTTTSHFPNMEAREGLRASDMETGARETYERLDKVLKELS